MQRSLVAKGLDREEWRRTFSELIRQIGESSTGCGSVEDVRAERVR